MDFSNLITLGWQYLKNCFGFILSMIAFIPSTLFAIFDNLPPYFRYGLTSFLSFLIFTFIAKTIALIISSVKG